MKTGVGVTWSTAVLFIFSIIYFSMMSDLGLFDPLVNFLVKKLVITLLWLRYQL